MTHFFYFPRPSVTTLEPTLTNFSVTPESTSTPTGQDTAEMSLPHPTTHDQNTDYLSRIADYQIYIFLC